MISLLDMQRLQIEQVTQAASIVSWYSCSLPDTVYYASCVPAGRGGCEARRARVAVALLLPVWQT